MIVATAIAVRAPMASAARSAAPGERRRERARTIRGSRAPASSAPACRSRAACSRLRAGCAGARVAAPSDASVSKPRRIPRLRDSTSAAGDPPELGVMRPLLGSFALPARPRTRAGVPPAGYGRAAERWRCADLRTACRAGSTRSGAPRSRAGRQAIREQPVRIGGGGDFPDRRLVDESQGQVCRRLTGRAIGRGAGWPWRAGLRRTLGPSAAVIRANPPFLA